MNENVFYCICVLHFCCGGGGECTKQINSQISNNVKASVLVVVVFNKLLF